MHNENPGEELNKLDQPGAYYGYPQCWSEHTLPSPHAQVIQCDQTALSSRVLSSPHVLSYSLSRSELSATGGQS